MTYSLSGCSTIAVLAVALPGCSIYPLPDNAPLNFARASTFDIIQEVRCEAKAGLDRFKNSSDREHVRKIIEATSIGYDFSLTMTETDNAADGLLQFFGKSAGASKRRLEADLSGSAAKTRENIRTFRLVEDLADVAKADCSQEALRANFTYPISGSLRVDDVAYAYVQLESMSDLEPLAALESDAADVEGDARGRTGVFSETIEFNTKIHLSATPTLMISVNAGSFGLKSASINGNASRSDQHSLIIAFAQDPNFKDEDVKRAVNERKDMLRNRVTEKSPRLNTALAQANADARNKVLIELSRLRHLRDDEQEAPKFLGERLLTFLRPPDETGPGDQP